LTQADALRQEVGKISWFHRIDLGNGIVTPGCDDSRAKLETLHLPASLEGLSVLDIGAWNGFFSFEAERRGARRVLATDSFCWSGEGWGTKTGFDLAKKALNSKVEEMEIDVMDLSPENVGVFDVVLFLGVLYHLRHPLLALEKIFSVTRGYVVVETVLDKVWDKRPVAAFYPGSELNADPSNWWAPNRAGMEAMLKSAGFKGVATISVTPSRPVVIYRAAKRLLRGGDFLAAAQQARGVFHAWRSD
jgi:tRNA (mo5U34)-methyltransferase